ncbi:hypothetical protein PINS_up005294 [Pythium insidiosum]|nr:hypothetical protein PINS_up005294 [Pythium insidiosum]
MPSLVHPDSPVDSTMFPAVYATKTELKISADVKSVTVVDKDSKPESIVYDSEIEPFEYNPDTNGALFLEAVDSLSSVFGDADLINSIMTSLESEQAAQLQAQQQQQSTTAPTRVTILPSTSAPILAMPTTTATFTCIRKPGTFLNKDGRWIKGKPCRIGNCDKRAQSNGLCKGHGGGARCSVDGCSKSSQGGGLCRAHGGGKRCMHEGCEKGTQRNGFCYLHGGVRSCSVEGCERKDRGNGKCFAHGGGRRCQAPYCLTTIRKGTYCDKHASLKPL